jgi:acetyltransferase-like isoleucine patch superfamily enzyme
MKRRRVRHEYHPAEVSPQQIGEARIGTRRCAGARIGRCIGRASTSTTSSSAAAASSEPGVRLHGVRLAMASIGPHGVHQRPYRAPIGRLAIRAKDDWESGETHVGEGASIGAGAVILPGVNIGAWSVVAAGAVVTADVREHALVRGNPARFAGWACVCGRPLVMSEARTWWCEHCERDFRFE